MDDNWLVDQDNWLVDQGALVAALYEELQDDRHEGVGLLELADGLAERVRVELGLTWGEA